MYAPAREYLRGRGVTRTLNSNRKGEVMPALERQRQKLGLVADDSAADILSRNLRVERTDEGFEVQSACDYRRVALCDDYMIAKKLMEKLRRTVQLDCLVVLGCFV